MQLIQLAKRVIKVALGRDLFVRTQTKRKTEFHGTAYGGWAIVPDGISRETIIYSVGVGDDISFDLSLIEKHGPQIFAFDPTPRSQAWVAKQNLPPQFHFFPYGLAASNGELTFYPPEADAHVSFSTVRTTNEKNAIRCEVRTLKSLCEMNGHEHIDILKIDIEGSEYDVIPNILNSGIAISQILVEFHHRILPEGVDATRKAINLLNESGYRLFAVSDRGEEFSFIRELKEFPH